jgi:CRISPR/Cas system CSM-associated protein Csm3 (group 7 of RAMP superfamily)
MISVAQSRIDRVQINYTLEFQTPFHFGTGMRGGLIDRIVIRDNAEYLYVPGSTIKGVVREKCEQLARLYEMDTQIQTALVLPHDANNALQDLGSRRTLITRLFGSQIRPGRLCFEDARLSATDKEAYDSATSDERVSKGGYKHLQVDISTQVRLDRPTRTAVEGALYTSEFGTRGMKFDGSIVGSLECIPVSPEFDDFFTPEPIPTYSLLLLLAGLHLLERLGGNKSAGKGQCYCKITKIILKGKEVEKDIWQDWMEHLGVLAFYTLIQEEEA